jgi:hypothetical protein
MKYLLYGAVFASLATPVFAAGCPSAKVVKKAYFSGFTQFDHRGNRLDNDPIGMIRSALVMGYMDEASVGVWKRPAGMTSDSEWKFNITLKRGIFGDGEVTFKGATVTYGGQSSCQYDFSEVSGLGIGAVTISGASAACIPEGAKRWKIKIPSGKNPVKIAASCTSGSTKACQLACSK